MAIINVIAKFVGTEVETGLERLNDQAAKFKSNLDKNLSNGSLSSMLTQLAAGFGALQVKDSIVNTFRSLAEDAERAADASERMRDAVNASINANNNAEGKLVNKRGDNVADKNRLSQVDAEMARMAREGEYAGEFKPSSRMRGNPIGDLIAPVLAGLQNWKSGAWGSITGQKANYEKLLAEKNDLQDRIQRNEKGAIPAGERAITTANRQTSYEAAQTRDEGLVMRGRISATEAQRRLIGDLGREYDATLNDPTKSEADRSRALIAVKRAETALIPIQAKDDQARIQGVMPQISASSLARIGGGGNVNVFGGREGALEAEARQHTQYLRTIAQNTAKGANGDVQ